MTPKPSSYGGEDAYLLHGVAKALQTVRKPSAVGFGETRDQLFVILDTGLQIVLDLIEVRLFAGGNPEGESPELFPHIVEVQLDFPDEHVRAIRVGEQRDPSVDVIDHVRGVSWSHWMIDPSVWALTGMISSLSIRLRMLSWMRQSMFRFAKLSLRWYLSQRSKSRISSPQIGRLVSGTFRIEVGLIGLSLPQ